MTKRHYPLIDFNAADLERRAERETEGVKRRVRAVIDVANGATIHEAAERMGITAGNLTRLLRTFNDGGFEGLRTFKLASAVEMNSAYDAESVRAVALEAKDENVRAKLMAIASLYEGDSLAEVGRVFGVSPRTVADWKTQFNARGPRSFTVEARIRREADLKVNRWNELGKLAVLEGALKGEDVIKAQAIRLSANGNDLEAVSKTVERPRSWTVAVIKTFNLGGVESLFPDVVKPKPASPKLSKQTAKINLPEGHTVKSLRAMAAQAKSEAEKENLEALAAIYLYRNIGEASQSTGMSQGRLSRIVSQFREGGVDAVTNRERIDDIDPTKVEAIAESYRDRKAAAKLFALARVIRGESYDAVSADVGASVASLRNWMTGLRKYGVNYFPEAQSPAAAWPVAKKATQEKTKNVGRKSVAKATPTPPVNRRILSLVASHEATPVLPEPTPVATVVTPAVIDEIPFVRPQVKSILDIMAKDSEYAGQKLARAVQEYIHHGNAADAASRFGVRESSIRTVFANLAATVEMYGEKRVRARIDEAGITPASVRRLASNPPSGWMSKLRSIGYLAEGKTVREVAAITHVDPAKLIQWTEELSGAWKEARTMAADRQVQPRKTAGFGR